MPARDTEDRRKHHPGVSRTLHVGRPNIGNHDKVLTRIKDMLERRWLSNDGPLVRELEQRLCELLNVKHCIAMCNGTVAMEIAIRALGLTGEVIIPSFTFIATAHALQWQQITPVFCDIDPTTHTLDPSKIERLLTRHTTGIVGVHLWGRPCQIDELQSLADRHGLTLLFDAAHAFGCSYNTRMIGGFGAAEVFSFHATKFFNTFEGGAVTTNNDELADKLRLMRNFGFSGYDNVIYIGTNGKMPEVCAAMGLTNLESLGDFVATNRRNLERYRQGLVGVNGVTLLKYDEANHNNYQYVVVLVDETIAGVSRDHLTRVLHDHNVLARKYFFPGCHRMEPYRSCFPDADRKLPITRRIAEQVVLLPTGTSVSEDDIDAVCEVIRRTCR